MASTKIERGVRMKVKYKGVYRHGLRFRAMAWIKKKVRHIGMFDTPYDAAVAYNKFCLRNGRATRLNKII